MSRSTRLTRASCLSRSAFLLIMLVGSLLGCSDERADDDGADVEADPPAEGAAQELTIRPSLCTDVLCRLGTRCNPKTGQCERLPTDEPVLFPGPGSCTTDGPKCPTGTFCRTVACTNSIPPSCFGVCTKP